MITDPRSSLTEKLRKRNPVERSGSFLAEVPLLKLIRVANLQSPVTAGIVLP